MKASVFSLNGRCTGDVQSLVRNKLVSAMNSSNHWSCSENNSNNSWNVNFSDGNFNNNNKNNSNVVRAVAALGEEDRLAWSEAFEDCCRHKLTSPQCVEYRAHFEEDLFKLAMEVNSRTYKPSTSTCFIVTRPKLREVFAANFRDRVVHHWICLRLEPLLEARFHSHGNVSFNCRKGFGTLAAVKHLEDELIRISENYTTEAWIGRFDLSSFFMSIDKEVLLSLLIPFIRKYYTGSDIDTLIYLTVITIRHQPQLDCEKRSPDELWTRLDKSKSLFYKNGMPIGNLPSQELANFFLSFMDWFVLQWCERNDGGYARFVDDFCVLCRNKDEILSLYRDLSAWTKKNLHLLIHPDKVYLQEAKKGVKFVGTVIKPGRRYTSNRTLGSMVDCIRQTDRFCAVIEEFGVTYRRLAKLENLVDGLNSYFGFCVHTNSYTIRRNMFKGMFHFWQFCFIAGRYTKVKIRKPYRLRNFILKEEDDYAKGLYRGRKTARSRGEKKPRQTGVYYQVRGGGRRRNRRT